MKILAINNYSLDEALADASRGVYPRHHCWGTDYLQREGHEVETLLFKPPRGSGLFRKCLYAIAFNLKLMRKVRGVDAVVAFANPMIPLLALWRKWGGLRRVRLYTLVHHFERPALLSSGYDKIFFLSEQIMARAAQALPALRGRFEFLPWGGDMPFYASHFEAMSHDPDRPELFFTNGKTARDVALVAEACAGMEVPLMVVTDKVAVHAGKAEVVASGTSGANALDYPSMLSLMERATVSVIPILPGNTDGRLAGLTSFIDAMALGTPVILSDNTHMGVGVEALGLGYTYKAGDKADFERAARRMVSDKGAYVRMSARCHAWAMEHDYLHYCRQLCAVLCPPQKAPGRVRH